MSGHSYKVEKVEKVENYSTTYTQKRKRL